MLGTGAGDLLSSSRPEHRSLEDSSSINEQNSRFPAPQRQISADLKNFVAERGMTVAKNAHVFVH
jgi:hypothetical protein